MKNLQRNVKPDQPTTRTNRPTRQPQNARSQPSVSRSDGNVGGDNISSSNSTSTSTMSDSEFYRRIHPSHFEPYDESFSGAELPRAFNREMPFRVNSDAHGQSTSHEHFHPAPINPSVNVSYRITTNVPYPMRPDFLPPPLLAPPLLPSPPNMIFGAYNDPNQHQFIPNLPPNTSLEVTTTISYTNVMQPNGFNPYHGYLLGPPAVSPTSGPPQTPASAANEPPNEDPIEDDVQELVDTLNRTRLSQPGENVRFNSSYAYPPAPGVRHTIPRSQNAAPNNSGDTTRGATRASTRNSRGGRPHPEGPLKNGYVQRKY